MLAGTTVAVEKTPAIGCSVKWLDKKASRDAELAGFAKEPVPLEKITVAEMKALAANTTGKTLLVNFWATWCAPCVEEFPELMDTWRMYRRRPFQLVTVSINYPDEEKAVRTFLEAQKASARNLMPAITEPSEIVEALDKEWNGGVPVLDGDRAGRQGVVPERWPRRHPQDAAHHPRQFSRRRLRRAERVLE